jgi:anaerobic ribonucleoside-triphosphate reductase
MNDTTTTEESLNFIKDYVGATNAANGSKYDANANVTNKNIATMSWEVPKKDNFLINRALMHAKIEEIYGKELADQYIKDLEHHIIYKHDETTLIPDYCASISLYPFLLDGLKKLGGTSEAPKNIDSFVGSFTNLLFIVASQLAGAVATPEWLTYMDHFLRKDYGEDYINDVNKVVEIRKKPMTLGQKIDALFQQVIYTVNQPAAARGSQSIFWNIAYFDHPYFENLFKGFVFPDGDEPKWETTSWLQKRFMKWFNAERLKTVITFPVETMNLLTDENGYVDKEWADFAAEMWAEGASFFVYRSNSIDALSSCCRLRNAIEDNSFSYTLGAGAIETGSKGVITMNLNRIVQDWHGAQKSNGHPTLPEYLAVIVERVQKYLTAFNQIVWYYADHGMLEIYPAGFGNLDKKYLTIGINGFVEGAEFLGYKINAESEGYKQYAKDILKTIADLNKKNRTEHCRFNTEFTPSENLGVKNAKWDKKDGYIVPRDVYNSYFYVVEDEHTDILEKFMLHGKDFTGWCDGGSALHMNLANHLTKEQYRMLLDVAWRVDCPYFTYNIRNTVCNDCGYISKRTLDVCPKCGSKNLDYLTRVIGYLRRISNFSQARQIEAKDRYYASGSTLNK